MLWFMAGEQRLGAVPVLQVAGRLGTGMSIFSSDPVSGYPVRIPPGMMSNWKLICFTLMVCMAPAPIHAAAPTKPAAEAGATGKATAKVNVSPKAKPKAKPNPKAKVKPKGPAAKPRAEPARLQAKEAKPVRSETPVPPADEVALNEGNLDAEAAAARRAVTDNPGDTKARERLARIAVLLVDYLLRAEAVGDTAKAGQLEQKLNTNLHDTGWRVQKMAQSGDLMARQATGLFLERGLLLEKDTNRSCAEFLAAAEQFATAGWHAAQCLMKVAPDKAWMQMERAAVRGHATAQEWMGRRCLGEFGATESDYACARSWLGQSASQGRSRSQTLLAYLLMNGHGGPVDESRAARLYRLAADQGDVDAQNNLGEINEMGRGVAPNPEEALRWYLSAAEAGLGSAQFNAGRLLAIGVRDKKDPARARALLVQAEAKGIEQARQVLNWLDRQGVPESREPAAQSPATVLPGESKRD